MLENLLVCLRHCYVELNKYKGAGAMSVLYLYQFQYLILAQALHYFHEDAQDGGGLVGVAESRASYIPTLSSSSQTPGEWLGGIRISSTPGEWGWIRGGPTLSSSSQTPGE